VNLKTVGLGFLCAFVLFDAFVRFKLKSIGRKWVFLKGGTLDYREYLRVRTKYGWPVWPVYLLWTTLAAGLVLVILGVASGR
jgi:hypothetical protein